MTEAESREMTKQARRRQRDRYTKDQVEGKTLGGGFRVPDKGYKRAKAGARHKEW